MLSHDGAELGELRADQRIGRARGAFSGLMREHRQVGMLTDVHPPGAAVGAGRDRQATLLGVDAQIALGGVEREGAHQAALGAAVVNMPGVTESDNRHRGDS